MINTTGIILIIVSLLVAIALPVCSAYFRKLRKPRKYVGTEGIKMPGISVIVSAFNDPEGVLRKMNMYLTQQYPGDYEVILVVDNEKVKEEAYQYQLDKLFNKERLHVTYVPDSSHYMGLQKLAVTLGVKAAKYEWIMLTDAHTVPDGDMWLSVMARNCTGKDIVLGYTSVAKEKYIIYKKEQRFDDFIRFERLLWQLYNLHQAEHGPAYSTAGGNMMFKKSMFMNGRGYQGNLKYTFGEYEFLVNTYSQNNNVAVETLPEAWCTKDRYTEHEFNLYHRCFQETRKHLLRRCKHRLVVAIDQAVLLLSFPIYLLIIFFSISNSQWISTTAAIVLFALGILTREWLAKKAMKRFRVEIKSKFITLMELSLLWLHVKYKLMYWKADKTEFISHKY